MPEKTPTFGQAVWYNGGTGMTERFAEVSAFEVVNFGSAEEGMIATLHVRDDNGAISIKEDVPFRSADDGGDDPETGGHTWRFASW